MATWQLAKPLLPLPVAQQVQGFCARSRPVTGRHVVRAVPATEECSLQRLEVEQQYFREVGAFQQDFGACSSATWKLQATWKGRLTPSTPLQVGDGDRPDLSMAAPASFYELLNVDATADATEIKQAYRALQRVAHPDIAGDRANVLATLLNSAVATLTDPSARQQYDRDLNQFQETNDTFDGHAVSSWHGSPGEDKAAFVDEVNCIGCTQ